MQKRLTILIAGLTLLMVGGSFYWWQWRPAEIRKVCNEKASEAIRKAAKSISSTSSANELYDLFFTGCLHKNGL